jgi:hypothetical protein
VVVCGGLVVEGGIGRLYKYAAVEGQMRDVDKAGTVRVGVNRQLSRVSDVIKRRLEEELRCMSKMMSRDRDRRQT